MCVTISNLTGYTKKCIRNFGLGVKFLRIEHFFVINMKKMCIFASSNIMVKSRYIFMFQIEI